jgi:hypothetical protein
MVVSVMAWDMAVGVSVAFLILLALEWLERRKREDRRMHNQGVAEWRGRI